RARVGAGSRATAPHPLHQRSASPDSLRTGLGRSMIVANGISKAYASRAVLDRASLELRAGECVVLTGDNGSGKTTLLHVMVGLRRPDAGEVRWRNRVLTGATHRAWREARETWGFMPQQARLPPSATASDALRLHARLRRWDHARARARCS